MGSQIAALFGGLFGDAGQEFVDLQGGPDKVFGTKPDIEPFVPVNLSDETGKAVAGNVANFDAVTEYLNKLVPGFTDILTSGLTNAGQLVSGEIPDDIKASVMRSGAFSSLMGGFSGTPMAKALTARDLGLTSLNLMQLGQNSAQAWTQLAEQAYSPFTSTTSQQAAVTAANNAGTLNQKQLADYVKAAPDPGALGIFNVDAALGQQMLSLGGALGGMAMGGGGGGGGGTGSAQAPMSGVDWTSNAYQGAGLTYNPATGNFEPTGGSAPAWAGFNTSDVRLKQHIRFIERLPNGLKLYQFCYRGARTIFQGLISQQVKRVMPKAILESSMGYMLVNYPMTGVKLKIIA